jgi:uncharacterized membrane protein YdbT with pleckstrin-like domain
MTEIPAIVFLTVCIIEYKTGGVSHNFGYRHYIVYCRKGFSLHTVVVPERKVCTIRKSQTIFQQRNETSDVTVITCGEKGVKHTARGVISADFDIIDKVN